MSKQYYSESFRENGTEVELGYSFYEELENGERIEMAFFPIKTVTLYDNENVDVYVTIKGSELDKLIHWMAHTTAKAEFGGHKLLSEFIGDK